MSRWWLQNEPGMKNSLLTSEIKKWELNYGSLLLTETFKKVKCWLLYSLFFHSTISKLRTYVHVHSLMVQLGFSQLQFTAAGIRTHVSQSCTSWRDFYNDALPTELLQPWPLDTLNLGSKSLRFQSWAWSNSGRRWSNNCQWVYFNFHPAAVPSIDATANSLCTLVPIFCCCSYNLFYLENLIKLKFLIDSVLWRQKKA